LQQLPQPGERIGAYLLEEVLASGGQGTVYRARHGALGTPVAVKILHTPDPTTLTRFQREAQTLATLRHPGLVRVADLGRSQGGFNYLVMDFVEGQTLLERVRRGGPLSAPEAVEVLAPVAEALLHCHSLGILHRDVKPENILLSQNGPLIVDFGLVRRDPRGGAPLGEAEAQRLTQTGEILGTPSYMAPEQADGSKAKIDTACDVYGLSATLFFALTGEPPFKAGSLFATLNQVLNGPPPSLRGRPGVPAALADLCLESLAKDPAERPTTEGFAGRLRESVAPASTAPRAPILALATLCVVLAGAGLGYVAMRRSGAAVSADASPSGPSSRSPADAASPSPSATPSRAPSPTPTPTPISAAVQLPPLPTTWTEIKPKGPRWTPRRQPSAVAWRGRLWVFPEAGDRRALQQGIYSSRDLGGTWTRIQTTFAPAPQRTGSLVHQGALYRIGGFSSRARYPARRLFLRGDVLDVSSTGEGPEPYTADMNPASLGEDIWIAGASSTIKDKIPLHERFSNVVFRMGYQGHLGFKLIRRPEWGPRYGAKALVHEGKLFLLGGRLQFADGSYEFCSEVWWTEDPTQGWTQTEVLAPFADTAHHAGCVWRGRMWITGGSNRKPGPTTLYHSADGVRWEALKLPGGPPVVSSASLVPLDEDSAVLLGGQVTGTGGETMKTSNQVWLLQ
jgi:serine/threonine protein kinase